MSRKILVPIDLADMKTSSKVLEAAVEQWQSTKDPQMIVMTVVPDIVTGIDYRYAIRGERRGSQDYDLKKIVGEALARLNEVAAEAIPDGIAVQTIARHGSVYEQVLEVAEELGVDQIVIGAHRPAASDFLIGPNTARIVRHAKCSVTVVRN